MLHSLPTLVFKALIPGWPILYLLPLPLTTVPCSWLFFYVSFLLSPDDSLRVLQWHAGGLRARSTEVLHFLSSHPVDLICIQESNLNSYSSFRIPGFSALRSDRTHSRYGTLSHDATHASGGVIIFIRQGSSFSELSTSSLSSLDPCSNYVGVNISLNNSSLLSFLDVYASPYSLFTNGWQNRLVFSLHSFLLQKALHSGDLRNNKEFFLQRLETTRILPAAPADTRPRTPLVSFCTVQLRTLSAAYSLATLYFYTTSGPDPGELLEFWGSMIFCHVSIPRRGRVINNNNNNPNNFRQ